MAQRKRAQPTAPATRGTDRRRWIVLAVIVTAQFMVVLDVAIVNVALPTIKTDLHFSQDSLQWVVTAYSILFGAVLLLGGRLADVIGRRRMFMAGLALSWRCGAACACHWWPACCSAPARSCSMPARR